MANIVLTGDTSGAITVAAPAVAGTNTLTLPASTGTVALTSGVGKILQVLQDTATATVETTSGSYVETGLSQAITVSAGNKVLVLGVLNAVGPSGSTLTGIKTAIFRGTTEICAPSLYAGYNTASTNHTQPIPLDFLDTSPATGANTYTVKFLRTTGSASARVQVDTAISRLILCEVAA
jgi:hypothetical protein